MVSILASGTRGGDGEVDGGEVYTGVADTSISSVHDVSSRYTGMG